MKDFDLNNDKVFRDKLTSHEFEFDSSAWDKMEKIIDDEDPRRTIAWRYPHMMIILGIFFGGITLLSTTSITDNIAVPIENIILKSINTIPTPIVRIEPAISISRKHTIVTNEKVQTSKINKTYIENSVNNNVNSTLPASQITPSNLKTAPIDAVKDYIETIPSKATQHKNIQAFMEVNRLLQPVKHQEVIVNALPFSSEPISLKNKRVKAGIQAGASVVLAKRSISDQGKLATAIGGFINFDLDSKNTITVEANYKSGHSKGTVLALNDLADLDAEIQSPTRAQDNNSVQPHGFTEVNNIDRVQSFELPVIYKRKIGKRNSLMAGVKPSLIKFKTSQDTPELVKTELNDKHNLSFDFGLVAGIEHRINRNLSVDLRYNQGLLDISDVDEVRNTNSEMAMTVKYTF